MANYAQTVNVIGAIKTSAVAAEMEPTGLALALYRRHFGALPVAVRADAAAPLDVAAAWTNDRRALTVAVVNPDPARARALALDVTGARLSGRGTRYLLGGAGPEAGNAPGRPRGVTVVETPLAGGASGALPIPPASVSLFVLEAVR
jgi:alpha-N-arabinofuranosidase